MAFDVEKFIADTGLTGQDAEDARRIAKSNAKFGEGWMRQDEFDRRFNESKTTLQAEQAKLDARRQELDAEYGSMSRWKTDSEGELTRAKQAVIDAEARVKKANDAVQAAARDAGRDAKDYLGDEPPPRREEPTRVPGADDKKFVDADTLAAHGLGQLAMTEQLFHIGEEHRRLFGTPLPQDSNLTGKWTAALKRGERVSLVDVFEKEFNVPAKRQELSEVKRKAEIDDAVNAALTKDRSERALRGGNGYESGDGKPTSPALVESFERTAARRAGVSNLDGAVRMYQEQQARIAQQQNGGR